MSRVPPLQMTRQEAVTLMLLVGVGGSAFDIRVGMSELVKKRFEKEFEIEISDQDIRNIMNKVGNLIQKSGTETVVIDD
jgi:predicted amino acid-binding ACT domain protein